MQSNRRRDTKPELAIRSALHRLGFRYRVDHLVLLESGRARPDIVFTRKRIAVFVDGCFWHVCPDHCVIPGGVNEEYWRSKLARNQQRDRQQDAILSADGWRVIRIWEHDPVPVAVERVLEALAATEDPTSLSRGTV